MIARIIPVLFAFVLGGLALAQSPEPFEYGSRPPLSVFDPGGFLDPAVVKQISDPLTTIQKNEGIDVLVIVLPDLENAPPEHVARRFAKAWCSSPIQCVVLHVPGRKDSPWIVPAGKLVEVLEPDQVRQAVEDGQRRAALENNEPDKVRAAATEAADMLRYWTNNLINRTEMMQTERTKMRAQLESKARLWRLGALLTAASIIPIIAGVSLLIFWFRRRGPRYFPNRAWQLRLGAPHAGGNHAVASIGPPQP
ncbi:MAG: TPM domain-containing protein [Luteolibacter sp.]